MSLISGSITAETAPVSGAQGLHVSLFGGKNYVSPDRLWLRDRILACNTASEKHQLITEILEAGRVGVLSPAQVQVLAFATFSSEWLYAGLDKRLEQLTGMRPRNCSELLLGVTRSEAYTPGVLSRLEDRLHTARESLVEHPGIQLQAREFFEVAARFLRSGASLKPFSAFMRSDRPSIEAVTAFKERAQKFFLPDIPAAIQLTDRQFALLRSLVSVKADQKYTTLEHFAASLELDVSGISRAFKGTNKHLSLFERVASGARLLGSEQMSEVEDALTDLKVSKVISSDKAALLRTLLDRLESRQNELGETQARVTSVIFELAAAGEEVSITTIRSITGLSDRAVREMCSPGYVGFETLDRLMASLAAEDRGVLADLLIGSDHLSHRGLLKRIAETPAHTGELQELKEHLARLACVFMEYELSAVEDRSSISDSQSWNFSGGDLHRARELIRKYLIECSGNAALTLRTMNDVASGERSPERTSRPDERFLLGRRYTSKRVPGAVEKFRSFQEGRLRGPSHTTQAGEVEQVFISESVRWATRILQASSARDAIGVIKLYLASRPATLREVSLAAATCARDAGERGSQQLFHQLAALDSAEERRLESEGAGATVALTLTTPGHTPKEFADRVKLLAQAALHRGVSPKSFARFISAVHRNIPADVRSACMEALVLHCYKGRSLGREPVSTFIRAAWTRFVAQEFSPFVAPSHLLKHMRSYSSLRALRDNQSACKQEESERIQGYVQEFFSRYRLETVIYTFARYLIQSPAHPRGIPLADLLDEAHAALLKAAEHYDPNRQPRNGKSKSSFCTFAIVCIRRMLAQVAERQRRYESRIEARLEEPLGRSGEDEGSRREVVADPTSAPGDRERAELPIAAKQRLTTLSPIQQRVLELRCLLGNATGEDHDAGYQSIAEQLAKEGLTEHRVTKERIRQIIVSALAELRVAVWTGSQSEWDRFLKKPGRIDRPQPLAVRAGIETIRIGEGIEFKTPKKGNRVGVVYSVAKVLNLANDEHDVLIVCKDLGSLKPLARYMVSVSEGRIVSSDLVWISTNSKAEKE